MSGTTTHHSNHTHDREMYIKMHIISLDVLLDIQRTGKVDIVSHDTKLLKALQRELHNYNHINTIRTRLLII